MFKELFFRPKWQHKDGAVRRDAVVHGSDPGLLEALPQIACDDPDAQVRLVALKRLGNFALYRDRSAADPDPALRATARDTFLAMLEGSASNAPPIEMRMAALDVLQPAEIERMAVVPREVALRKAALSRVNRPALVADRAIGDPDPDIRLAAFERITQTSTLERVAEATRKSDKRIHRLARERLEADRWASGDAQTIAARATALCTELEVLLRDPGSNAAARLAAIEATWSTLAAKVDEAMRLRFDGALRVLKRALEGPKPHTLNTDERADALLADLLRLRHDLEGQASLVAVRVHGETLQRLTARWAELESAHPAGELRTRIEQALQEIAERFATIEHAQPAPEKVLALAAAAESLAVKHASTETAIERLAREFETAWRTVPQSNVAALASKARFDAALGAAREHARQEQNLRETQRQEMIALLPQLEAKLDAGDLAGSRTLSTRMQELIGKGDQRLPADLRENWQNAGDRLRELARWQQWSNDRQRARLCEEIEALVGSGLHPDAVATKIREAQAEWLRLDKSQALPGAAATESESAGITRRFRALCHRAIKPAKPYFEKRDELRKTHKGAVLALCEKLDGITADSAEWTAMSALRREAGVALRALDSVDPRDRKTLAERLKTHMTAIDARLDAHYADVEQRRARLVVAAAGLVPSDAKSASKEAKDLQTRWQAIEPGRRRTDQSQWNEFRAALDGVFGRLDSDRQARGVEREAQRSHAEKLCVELEALVPDLRAGKPESTARQRQIETSWQELRGSERDLETRFQAALAAAQEARNAHRLSERSMVFEHAFTRAAVCAELEASAEGIATEDFEHRWSAIPSGKPALDKLLAARFAQALEQRRSGAAVDAPAPMTERLEKAQRLAIEIEFLAGVDSPESARAARKDYQLERLAARMRGGSATASPEQELQRLLSEWFGLSLPMDDSTRELNARALGATRSLLATL